MMNIFARVTSIILLLAMHTSFAAEQACHLAESKEGGKIYKTCNGQSKIIKFDYNVFVVSLSDDNPKKSVAILWQTPKASEMSDERYFIFDYKNMIVYDNKCLGGNFIIMDDNKDIVFTKYGESSSNIFTTREYEHCKQPLEKWVKMQQKW
jgi:hypothetical protein